MAAVAVTLAAVGCGGSDNQTNNESKPVCDGKLTGDVFETLVGDSGVVDEKVSTFSPKEWTASGYCNLYGKKHSVEIDYLWHTGNFDDLDSYKTAAPSTVRTFKVDSAVGYVERNDVRVAAGDVYENRARVVIPCFVPGRKKSEQSLLEVEVKEPSPARTLDDSLRKAFIEGATLAAHYVGGEVFNCSAVRSATSSGTASQSASDS